RGGAAHHHQHHAQPGRPAELDEALDRDQRDQRGDGLGAVQQRAERVQPAARRHAAGRGRSAHSPSPRSSPRAVSRSRSRDASAGSGPGTWASVPAAAVWSCTVASPSARSTGPAVTSTNCIRAYGTMESRRTSRPWRTSRSRSRSAYPQARTARTMAIVRSTPYPASTAKVWAGQGQNSSVATSTRRARKARPASIRSSSTTISLRETGRHATVPGQGSSGLSAAGGVPLGAGRGRSTPASVCPGGPLSRERLDLPQEAARLQEAAQVLPVVRAGEPGLAPLRRVQLGVVPAQRPTGGRAAAPRRADQRLVRRLVAGPAGGPAAAGLHVDGRHRRQDRPGPRAYAKPVSLVWRAAGAPPERTSPSQQTAREDRRRGHPVQDPEKNERRAATGEAARRRQNRTHATSPGVYPASMPVWLIPSGRSV